MPRDHMAGARYGYRLRFRKEGAMIFLGHLDLVRHLPRIFRRADLPLGYSSGFRPKPELTFSPALGLGTPSWAEYVDVKLTEPVDVGTLVPRLNAVTLDGIQFEAAVSWQIGKDKGLGGFITASAYVVALPPFLEPEALQAGLDAFAGDGDLSIVRAPKEEKSGDKRRRSARTGAAGAGIGRRVDIRRSVSSVASASPVDRRRTLDVLGLEDGWSTVRYQSGIGAEGGARPKEIVTALWGRKSPMWRGSSAWGCGARGRSSLSML